MSIQKNAAGAIVPVRESRRKDTGAAPLAATNAELVLDLDGDSNCTIHINSNGVTLNATYDITGTVDGTNYDPLLAYPYSPGCVGGTIPVAAQPLTSEAVNNITRRTLCVAVGGLRKVRVRLSSFTAGSAAVTMNADSNDSIHPYVKDQKAATLIATATGVAGAAVTATLTAVTGLRHYIDRISILRSMTVAQTATATPSLVNTTNLPGAPAFTFGTDAAAIGQDKEVIADFGGAGCAAVAVGTATTIIAPVLTGAIWRINVFYRLGI
jgi:hypothetical protein